MISLMLAAAFLLKDAVVAVEDAMVPQAADFEGPKSDPKYKELLDAARRKSDGFAAAEDMTNALSKVVGRAVPLYAESKVPKDAKAVIYLGDTKAAKAAGLDVSSFRSWEYLIRAEKGRAFVAARTGYGTSHGVTDALERFADYYFMLINGEDPYVRDPERAVEPCDIRSNAGICRAELYLGGYGAFAPNLEKYRRRLAARVGDGLEGEFRTSDFVNTCHSVYDYVSHERYGESMPELFNLIAGRYEGSQLCYSNPMTWRIAFDSLKGYVLDNNRFRPDDPPHVFDFSQKDCTRYLCQCRKCSQTGGKYLRGGVLSGDGLWCGGDAGVQLEFVNRLAREIAKVDSNVVVRTFAYNSTAVPPRDGTITVEPNVEIRYVDLYAYTDHMLPHTHKFNAEFHKYAQIWRKLAKRMSVWDYMLYGDDCPELAVDAIPADAKFWRELRINDLFMEHDFAFQPFFELNSFLCAQFYRNPDADVEKLVDIYCRSYGKGAAKMREAIDDLRRMIINCPPGWLDAWTNRLLWWRTTSFMERLRKRLLAAYEEADDPVSKARIALPIAVTCRELARTLRKDPKAYELMRGPLDEYVKYWEEYMSTPGACAADPKKATWEKGFARSNRDAMMPVRFKDLPPEVADLPLERLIFRDWRTGPGYMDSKPEDPDSETGRAIRYAQDIATNGVRMSFGWSPRWFGKYISGSFTTPPLKADGKYRWYRLGVARIWSTGAFTMPPFIDGWGMGDYSRDEPKGSTEDLNRYEFWVSLKLIENDYVVKMAAKKAMESTSPDIEPDETAVEDLDEAPIPIENRKFAKGKTPGVYMDRLLLVRQPGKLPEKR